MPPKHRPSPAPSPAASKTTPATTTPSRAKAQPTGIHSLEDAQELALKLWQNYLDQTPTRTRLLDMFLAFLAVVSALQFVYCCIGGTYPFNAFLSGFGASVGQFVLTCSLRMQTNQANTKEFGISHERAFADYVFGSLILHFFCVNFIN